MRADGFYWVQREGVEQPEIALTIEGSWGGLDWDEDDWSVPEGEPAPKVLIGPLDKPVKVVTASVSGQVWDMHLCGVRHNLLSSVYSR